MLIKKRAMNKISLTSKIFIALLLGLVIGIMVNLTGPQLPLPAQQFVKDNIVLGLFTIIGQIFVNAIRMLVVPLVLVSLIAGVANIGDVQKLGRIGGRTIIYYMATTAIAIAIAIILAILIRPGVGLDLVFTPNSAVQISEPPSFSSIIINLLPHNPFNALANGEMLQVIAISVISGIAMASLGDQVKHLTTLLHEINEVIMRMITIIMYFAPIGIFGLIAKVFSEQGPSAFLPLLKYMFTVTLGLVIHCFIFYSSLLKLFSGLSPKIFFKKFRSAMLVGFSTSSSNASIPASISCLENQMGVSKSIASFSIPLGATVNMNGTAIMQGVAVIFISQIYGIQLSITDFILVILTATLASIGTAGVPGVGLITLSMVLMQVKLPVEGIAIIMGVDRILDMMRTVVNITGDAIVALIVSKKEKELDEKIYYNVKKTEEEIVSI